MKRMFAAVAACTAWIAFGAPEKIIFDTDMYTDFDDVGALATLHALADAGECEILGTVASTRGTPAIGMVEIINGAITIPNWGKHQSLDRLEKLREYQKEYHREYRKKQAQIPEHCEVDRKLYGEVDVNALDKEIDKNKKKNKKVFVPPTLDEVKEYIKKRNSPVDPVKFWEFYDAGEWVDSKGEPVRNWKQKVITWEKKDTPKKQYTTAAEYTPPNSKIDVEKLKQIKEMQWSTNTV